MTDRLSVAGGGHVRVFDVQTGAAQPRQRRRVLALPELHAAATSMYPGNGHPFDEGGERRRRAGARRDARHAARRGNWGDDGRPRGRPTSLAQHVFETRYVASVRTGVWQWDDKLQPDRSATTLQLRARRWATASRRGRAAMVEWEHDMNGLVGQRFRLMLWLSVAVGK